MTLKYKVLNADMTSPFQNFKYEIGQEYICSDFDEGPRECSRGFYATDLEGIVYTFRSERKVFLAEMGGRERLFDQFKHRFETQILIREVPHNELKELLKAECVKVGYNILEACFPINPLLIERSDICSDQEIQWLKEWDSVRESVRDSVWKSVWASVWASMWASAQDSMWAYTSSLFPNIKTWMGIVHDPGINPFQSGINLWKAGLVPSFDGTRWRLYAGPESMIIFEYDVNSDGRNR